MSEETVGCEHCKKQVRPRLIPYGNGFLARCPECNKPVKNIYLYKKEKNHDSAGLNSAKEVKG